MGSATSSIPTEPIVAVAALAGLGYGYFHYFRPAAHSGDEDAYSDANAGASHGFSALRGQKKRGRKLQLPGDATLKNLDILDAPVVPGSLPISTSVSSKTGERQRQAPPQLRQEQRERKAQAAAQAESRDVVPGGFDGTDEARDKPQEQPQPPLEQVQVQQHQQHVSAGTTKKMKKKKGKKAVAATSDPSSASALGASQSLATSTEGVVGKGKKAFASASVAVHADNSHDERWTRVEARRKKAPVQPQDGLAETTEATAADVTTSDPGITTSVTGNSSPVTERTTEDELRSDLDEYVSFFFLRFLTRPAVSRLICMLFFCRSALEASPSSLQDAPRHAAPVHPPPGEKPAKGFKWEDYEGVHFDEEASGEEDGGWGVVRSRRSQFLPFSLLSEFVRLRYFFLYRAQQGCVERCRRNNGYSYHHGRIGVTAADEEAAPECAETGGVERGEAGARGATAGCVRDAQARTRACSCGRAGRSKAYRISLRFAGLSVGSPWMFVRGHCFKNYSTRSLIYVRYQLYTLL